MFLSDKRFKRFLIKTIKTCFKYVLIQWLVNIDEKMNVSWLRGPPLANNIGQRFNGLLSRAA